MEDWLLPAIASLEDLKAAQKGGLAFYAMPHALCSIWVFGEGADTRTIERGGRRIRIEKPGTWTYGRALPPWVKIGLVSLQG
jgi:hypothetical protein